MTTTIRGLLWTVLALLAAACSGEISEPARGSEAAPGLAGGPNTPGTGAPGSVAPGAVGVPSAGPGASPVTAADGSELPSPRLRRLTLSQYQNSLNDLLGVKPDTSMLSAIPPLNGMRAIGASSMALPPRDVEVLETLASNASAQVFGDSTLRMSLTGCDPKQASCAEGFVASFGKRVFRRPLSEAERTRYLNLLRTATQMTGDGWSGLRVVTQAFLQSPNFLYRAELGELDSSAPRRRTLPVYELAARLSFFLWNTTPDAALLAAADSGELISATGLTTHVQRMLASARATDSIDELFADYLQLETLDSLVKLPEAYPAATATLPDAMKQETLLSLREFLWKGGGDFRDAFTSNRTFVNGELAKLYGVKAPAADGFSEVQLPANGPRAGLLTQASFLALHAHPGRSSPTLRGKFLRENLLCQAIPSPPDNVDTSLPAIPNDKRTARQRLTAHREDPSCAGCHQLMDPLGLALEHFDGIGAFRETDNGLAIDASGELDGAPFRDARGLADVIAAHPNTTDCFVRTVLRYARGTLENTGETALLAALGGEFERSGYALRALISAVATQPSFQHTGALQ
jgi:Protein of unknown function (DUF1592)/Protein of unknown function (DUF1588)/Protein of unknown function (DUF1595)/Protein of unknown function (DUF1585)